MPVYRIETERLVIRCWEPKDAPLLKSAIDLSIDHLLPWMPWAKGEPQTLEEKVELLRMFRGKFDLGQDFILGIFNRDETEVLGGTGFHPRRGVNERYYHRIDLRTREGRVREGGIPSVGDSLRSGERSQRGGSAQARLPPRGYVPSAHASGARRAGGCDVLVASSGGVSRDDIGGGRSQGV